MLMFLAASLALATPSAIAVDPATAPGIQTSDAAYAELVAGENAAAIAKLEQHRAAGTADHAMLVNLALAYEREGDFDSAERIYVEVAAMEEYELETADGRWISSRRLADAGMQRVDRTRMAMR